MPGADGRGGSSNNRRGGGRNSTRSKKSTSGADSQNNANSTATNANVVDLDPPAPCTKCKVIFSDSDDHLLGCERCRDWYCQKCVNMTDPEYEIMCKNDNLIWLCDKCKAPAIEAILTDRTIEERCNKYCSEMEERINSKIKLVEESIEVKADKVVCDSNTARIITLENQLRALTVDVSKVGEKVVLVRNEPDEKAKRVNNLIIRGVKEDSNSQDTDIVKAIFQDIGCEDIEIDDVARLGAKKDGRNDETANGQNRDNAANTGNGDTNVPENGTKKVRHRPIRVILKSVDDKKKILKNATKVRLSQNTRLYDPKAIFIIPDQTKMERERDLELRKKLRDSRSKNPNARFIIQKGKVVEVRQNQH